MEENGYEGMGRISIRKTEELYGGLEERELRRDGQEV